MQEVFMTDQYIHRIFISYIESSSTRHKVSPFAVKVISKALSSPQLESNKIVCICWRFRLNVLFFYLERQ